MSWTRLLILLPLAGLGCIPENDPPQPGTLTLRPQELLVAAEVASSKGTQPRNPLAKQSAGRTTLPPVPTVRDPQQVDPPRSGTDLKQVEDPHKRVPRLPHVTVPDVRGNRPRPQQSLKPDPILETLKALGSETPR